MAKRYRLLTAQRGWDKIVRVSGNQICTGTEGQIPADADVKSVAVWPSKDKPYRRLITDGKFYAWVHAFELTAH